MYIAGTLNDSLQYEYGQQCCGWWAAVLSLSQGVTAGEFHTFVCDGHKMNIIMNRIVSFGIQENSSNSAAFRYGYECCPNGEGKRCGSFVGCECCPVTLRVKKV